MSKMMLSTSHHADVFEMAYAAPYRRGRPMHPAEFQAYEFPVHALVAEAIVGKLQATGQAHGEVHPLLFLTTLVNGMHQALRVERGTVTLRAQLREGIHALGVMLERLDGWQVKAGTPIPAPADRWELEAVRAMARGYSLGVAIVDGGVLEHLTHISNVPTARFWKPALDRS